MKLKRVCPECRSEYLPQIEKCSDCGAVLLLPEELEKADEERRMLMLRKVEERVVVREGELKWLGELRSVLADAGIASTINSGSDCGKGSCRGECVLMVAPEQLERARERIEEYFAEMHPEIRASKELAEAGKCPACGSHLAPDAHECRDCGLPLVIIEEEDGE